MTEQPAPPVRVADFVFDDVAPDRLPSGPALVEAAERAKCERVVVDARATADGWVVVHPAAQVSGVDGSDVLFEDLTLDEVRVHTNGRVASLEETLLAAHRRKRGLVIRIHDTATITGLSAALGIVAGDATAALRSRFLIVVPDSRIGKRLRADARTLPSALTLRASGGGLRAMLARRTANLARASADADDLIVSATSYAPDAALRSLVGKLSRRGAFVWVSDVTPDRESAYASCGVGGLLLRLPGSTSASGPTRTLRG